VAKLATGLALRIDAVAGCGRTDRVRWCCHPLGCPEASGDHPGEVGDFVGLDACTLGIDYSPERQLKTHGCRISRNMVIVLLLKSMHPLPCVSGYRYTLNPTLRECFLETCRNGYTLCPFYRRQNLIIAAHC
jgi:hypothetical protein